MKARKSAAKINRKRKAENVGVAAAHGESEEKLMKICVMSM
jgi:hypothetical protein